MTRLRAAVSRGGHPPDEEIQLLDPEIFEAPRRLSLAEARNQTGASQERRTFDQTDPEDDR